MKHSFLFKPAVAVVALLLGLGSVAVQSCNHSTEVEPLAATSLSSNAVTPAEREIIISNNKAHLQDIQRVIALGLLDVSVNTEFVTIVNQLADANAAGGDDWRAPLTQIKDSYPSLASAMQTSLLAHGGTSADAELLNASLLGFTVDGVNFTPGVRLSYKDGTRSVSPVHVVATTQLYPQSAIPAWTYNGSAYEASTAGMHTLIGEQTWTVNLMLKEGEESTILYTSEAEPQNMESGSCRTSRLTGNCWSGGDNKRCRCAGYSDVSSSL